MDAQLRRLEQQVLGSPADAEARQRLRSELCRLANFQDRLRWKEADPSAQDVVIGVLSRLLGPGWEHTDTTAHQAGSETHRIASLLHRATGIVFQLIPGGSFLMGSDRPYRDDERPRRTVWIPGLLLARFPTLQSEWDVIEGEDRRSWRKAELPIEGVSWVHTRDWLQKTGDELRLPSEAEWEYACRAGTRTAFFWGDDMDLAYCWFGEQAWHTHAPREHADRPNAFGLVDMVGNVAEWCEDVYLSTYRDAPPDGTPARSLWQRPRVVRGGDGFNPASHCRSAYRSRSDASDHGPGIGFRVARDLPL